MKMQATTLDTTETLVPNKAHKSFTGSNIFIKKGETVTGNPIIVKGLRKGQFFNYRLFKTDKNQYIFLDKIKINPSNMETEVKLGADAGQTPTVVDVSKAKTFGKTAIISALVGAGLGYAYCKHKKHDSKKTALYVLGGAALGYVTGKYIQAHQPVIVKPSK